MFQEGQDVQDSVEKACNASKSCLQPYMLYVSGQRIDKYFIVGNGQMIEVEKNASPLVAFDLLFKLHYVTNVKFADSLPFFYNFIETYFYKTNKTTMSSVKSFYSSLKNLNLSTVTD